MSHKEQPIIYPIFDECKNFTLDSFWREELGKLAYNKFPPGLRYDAVKNNLTLKLDGKKIETYSLSENPADVFQIVMKILKGKYDMRSSRDLKIQKSIMDEAMKKRETDLDCEFKNIKPRHLKDQLIMDYLVVLKSKHSLTTGEFKNLVSVVQLGFQFRELSPNDVVYINGEVTDIQGLVFDEKERSFTTPETVHHSSSSKSEKRGPDRFYSCLKKFMSDDNNRVRKYC